jgi:hypothetical protein
MSLQLGIDDRMGRRIELRQYPLPGFAALKTGRPLQSRSTSAGLRARTCLTLVLYPFRGSVPRAMTKYEELQAVCIRRGE